MVSVLETRLDQAPMLPKECAHPWPVVLIAQTNLRTQARAHVVLLRRDLDLAYALLVDDDGLRFQSECTCREATQDWGLEDCMNVLPTGVTNAAHLSWFMVNVANRLRADLSRCAPDSRVLDWQAGCRGSTYVAETIPRLPEKPEPIVFAKIRNQVAGLGRMHASQPSVSFA